MVIQRSWKILSDAGSTSASSTEANRSPGLNTSSDDSNCSNQTTHSMVTSVASPLQSGSAKLEAGTAATPSVVAVSTSAEPIKFVTTPQMAENTLQRLRQRLGFPVAGSGTTSESAMRSLELLRISLQSAFDKEIDAIVKRYVENYFKPSLNNIKENLGQSALSEDTIQKMSCALLENSKAQYNAFRIKTPSHAYLTTHAGVTAEHPVRVATKRPATATKSSVNHELTKKFFPVAQAPQRPIAVQQATNLAVQKTTAVTTTNTNAAPTTRRQIFWNTAHISTTTKFVLDVQANQAFGFGTDGKERLASKHPELIRYLPDGEDRDWLTAQNIISSQNHNSRFLFLIHDEVWRLQQTHDSYRNKPNVDLSMMHTFQVPEFMIQKMKLFFVDLNIKSRGLITNSFSVGVGAAAAATEQGNSHLRSHLRNALLQGVQPAADTSTINVTTPSVAPSSNSVSTTSESATSQQKPKTSTLSSSHATLTALLNNSALQ